MFTLGNKEAIVNTPNQYPITLGRTPGSLFDDLAQIQGFGLFNTAKIVDADGQRAKARQLEKLAITCPDPATVLRITAVGTPVVVHIRVNSLRQAAETSIDFIKRGRPIVLEIKLDPTDANTDVATKLAAALTEFAAKFPNALVPITWSVLAEVVTITATEGFFQINESVTFLKRGDIFAYEAPTTKLLRTSITINDGAIAPGDNTIILSGLAGTYDLGGAMSINVDDTFAFLASPTILRKVTEIVVGTSTVTFEPALVLAAEAVNGQDILKVASGVEAVNDGKYLEENVRMSTPYTSDTYAIKPQEVPIIGATYTMVAWDSEEIDGLTGGWQSHKVNDIKAQEYKVNRFTLYFNDATCLLPAGPVQVLYDWLLQAGPVTDADFKKANGASAVSSADFIA